MLISDDQLKKLVLSVNLLIKRSLNEIEEYAKNSELRLSDGLIEKDVVTDENLGILIADSLKIPFIVLSKISITDDVYKVLPERIARKYKVIPLPAIKTVIKLAMMDPSNKLILEMVERKTGQKSYPLSFNRT